MGLGWYRSHREQEHAKDRTQRYPSETYRAWNRDRMRRLRSDPVYGVFEEGRRTRRRRAGVIERMRKELAVVA